MIDETVDRLRKVLKAHKKLGCTWVRTRLTYKELKALLDHRDDLKDKLKRWVEDNSLKELNEAFKVLEAEKDDLILRIKLHEDPVYSRRQIIVERDMLKAQVERLSIDLDNCRRQSSLDRNGF